MAWRLKSIVIILFGSNASLLVAAGLGQQHSIEEILVTANQLSSATAQSASESQQQLKKIPGGIGFVEAEDFLDNFTQSIGDALLFTPGVFADTSAQRENRISIRGSGLNATFERRGITVLRDGVPISRASGITEFQEIDPLSIQYIEVFKGANGLRYGAASLGGAINIVTPTGKAQQAGTNVRLEGGSFNSFRSSINTAGAKGNIDYYGAVTKLDSDGFRQHAEVDSTYAFGNVGISLSDMVETRFYVTALQDDFELAGSLSLDQALNNPKMSPPSNIVNDQDRNLDVYRVSNRTVFSFDQGSLETGAWFASRKLDHAITPFVGIIDQDETEWGVSAELEASSDKIGLEQQWKLGFSHAQSDNEAKVFVNAAGLRGNLSSEDDQDAANTVIYAQLDTSLSEQWQLILGAQYIDSERNNRNIFALPAFPGGPIEDDTGFANFDQLSKRIGLLWSVSDDIQHYFNISEGYEPPGISDLTSGGAFAFTPLEAQESISYEIGSRGRSGALAWDVAIYRSDIESEFIDVVADGFAPGTTITNTSNAVGDTVHQGVELGLDIHFLGGDQSGPLTLVWRNILTYSDFSFDNDPTNGNNILPGVPEVIYVSELRMDYNDTWYAAINVRHVANGPYADYANTLQIPGYDIWGLTVGGQVNSTLRVFASVENVADERFIANVSTVADLSTEGNPNIFTPGEGRAAYVGISASF